MSQGRYVRNPWLSSAVAVKSREGGGRERITEVTKLKLGMLLTGMALIAAA